MDFKNLLEQSWKCFTEFLPALLVNTLVLLVVSVFTLGILYPVCLAGYTQSILLAIRDKRKPEVGDLFSHMNLFLPLLGFSIVAFIVIFIGFVVMVVPGFIAAIAICFFFLYMLPLMTDKGMGLIEAAKESGKTALEDPVIEHVAVVAIYLGLNALGQIVPFGIIFTLPVATIFILYVFEQYPWDGAPSEAKEEPVSAPPPPPPPEAQEASPEPEKKETPPEPEEKKTVEGPEEKE